MSVRPALRGRLRADERLIAWGVGEKPKSQSEQALSILVGMTPIVGLLLAQSVSRAEARLLVLTDQRLFILRPRQHTRGLGGGPLRTALLADVSVRRTGAEGDAFEIMLGDGVESLRLQIPEQSSRPAERLARALSLMARDEDAFGASE